MATAIVSTNQDAIFSEISISAPPERVFKALSDPGELQRWFGGSPECPTKFWQMERRLGGKYSYTTDEGALVLNDVSKLECHGEITEFDPPRVLAYTWFGNWHEDASVRTLVRWELTPKANGTHVKVTHSGLSNLPVARDEYSGGWSGVVQMLKKFVENN